MTRGNEIGEGTDRRGSRRWRKRRWWWRIGDNRECWSCRRLWWREGCDQRQGTLVSSMQWYLCSSFSSLNFLSLQPSYNKSLRHSNLNTTHSAHTQLFLCCCLPNICKIHWAFFSFHRPAHFLNWILSNSACTISIIQSGKW